MNHICFLSSSFPRFDSRIYMREARSLVSAGYKVTYVVSDSQPDEIIDGVEIISTGYLPSNRIQRFFFTKRHLIRKAISLNADIYQVSEPALIPVGLKLKRLGKSVIYDMREDYVAGVFSKAYLPKFSHYPVSKLLNKYMSINLKQFDAIFAVDPHLVDIITKEFRLGNVHLVTNYPIINRNFTLSFEDYNKRGNILYYSGSVYRISRQEVTFKALEKIPELKYVIAGQFWDNYKADIELIPFWNQVDFIDGIDRNKVKELHQQVSIGNALRDFSDTGFPNGSLGIIKIYEYMEAALPVICSDVTLWRQMVDKYHCGICVNSNDENEIEAALKYLVEHKEEAYQMGQNGRRAVLEEYNWETQAKIYLNEIRKLIN